MAKRKAPSTAFKPGQSGNPGGRPKIPQEVKELARTHTEDAMQALIDIAGDNQAPPSSRVQAAQALLDRGWGKATQHIEAQVGPLDNLSENDQRNLLEALTAISAGEGDAEEGTGATTH